MKALILFLLLTFPLLINAQAIRIPDASFLQRLISLGIDQNDNGKIEISEAATVKELDLKDLGIVNLEGINGFKNLEELICNNNKISKLDVSGLKKLKGLYIANNPLAELNVTGLTQLENLYIQNFGGVYGLDRSFLKSLDISTLTNLKELKCGRNLLTKLDVSGLKNLEILECEANRLESISLRNAQNLRQVNLKENPLVGTVDIRGLTTLEYFNCEGCQLLYLNMSGTVNLKDLIW
jgi:protein phosphatase 1 regulatory subunit 7